MEWSEWDPTAYQVERILDHGLVDGETRLKVSWVGFEETSDSWEPLRGLVVDQPRMVREYALRVGDEGLLAEARGLADLGEEEGGAEGEAGDSDEDEPYPEPQLDLGRVGDRGAGGTGVGAGAGRGGAARGGGRAGPHRGGSGGGAARRGR